MLKLLLLHISIALISWHHEYGNPILLIYKNQIFSLINNNMAINIMLIP